MGLRKSVFGVASSLVGLLRTRLELLALEAADEKARLLKLLGMAFAALLFLTLAVLVFTVTVAVLFWPTEDRYMALACWRRSTALSALCCCWLCATDWSMARRLSRPPWTS
ncbi:Predicted membrane protein [Achromobacter denitrificans]|nr:Predicted membrane protein [Achromobacter denitrificans]